MDELAALAAAAAATVVTAMATDAWTGVRDTVAKLFRRSRRKDTVIRARLDDSAELVEQAVAPDEARQALLGLWTLELSALLRADPASREPLERLVAEYRGEVAQERRAFLATQSNAAYGFGTVFGVQNGDLHIHAGRAHEGNHTPHAE